MENNKPMGALSLRGAHDAILATLKDLITDWDLCETAMTKTEEGYVFEIRYKDQKKGWPWRAELPIDPAFLKEKEQEVKP